MEAFYAAKFPRLPSEYHGILSRYSSGEILTKKQVKNTIKRANKKDRKSTRLNSSHGYISYAVYCSKKKKIPEATVIRRKRALTGNIGWKGSAGGPSSQR